MGLRRREHLHYLLSCFVILVFPTISSTVHADLSVQFSTAPPLFSASPTATFDFQISDASNGRLCSDCAIACKLDNSSSLNCSSSKVSYTGLRDGNHTFNLCANGSIGALCSTYNWTVDTTPPTAYITSESPFTNGSSVTVNISFSEPCSSGGFECNDSDCNLLVYGSGRVLPSTLKILKPGLEYSLLVLISSAVQYGRLVLVMDKKISCTDESGNRFMRTPNSSYILHFDRRDVVMNITTRIPKKLLQLNGVIRTVEATNDENYLKIYLAFSKPVLNSSTEILSVINTSSGSLIPTNRTSLGNRRFGYIMNNTSSMEVVTVSCDSSLILSRQGTPVSPTDPLTFLYDAERPSVKVTTYKTRTTERKIPVVIKFVKPVFDFNSSAIQISGGQILSFHETTRSIYAIQIQAVDKMVSVEVRENTTQDVSGNKNLASNILQVTHYSVPVISTVMSIITTAVFLATTVAAGLLTVSTSSLISSGAFSQPTSLIVSEPTRSLLRVACHIQMFALSRWLTLNLPIEYYEFTRGIEWIIPYHRLPWEHSTADSFNGYSTFPASAYSEMVESRKLTVDSLPLTSQTSLEGLPLTPMEYRSFLENQDVKPEAGFPLISQKIDGWNYFGRNMFWLAVIGGGLIILHLSFLLVFRLKKREQEKEKRLGAVVFPRFEVFLIVLTLPCICQASTALIKGGTIAGLIVGIVLIGVVTSFLVSLLLFLSIGITMGKIIQYKEVHREGQEFHWYQEIIRRTLGPGKRGQWTWTSRENSVYLTKLGPLFEDLRGPPKYMLSQITGGSGGNQTRGKQEDRIIASDDETEDAEAPFIQKLFGILRIYYTLLDSVKRVCIGILAGAHSSGTPSRTRAIVILSITSFQFFFMTLKKPFIKKKVQLVEIISVASEVCIFALCLVLVEKDFTDTDEKRIGIAMLAVFALMFVAQMLNEWYALYRQVTLLSRDKNSFKVGLKTALSGLLLVVLPSRFSDSMNHQVSSSNHGNEGDATGVPNAYPEQSFDRSWLRQLREMAKASFSKESVGPPNDPSSSNYQFWNGKSSRSSSITSSVDSKAKGDLKAKSRGLYKDLETIFSSK